MARRTKGFYCRAKKNYKKSLKENSLKVYNKKFGAKVQMEEDENNQDSDSIQNMFAIKKNSDSDTIKYFIKPVGSVDDPFKEDDIVLDGKMYFSKRFPRAIDEGSIMIAYGVGAHRIIGYYQCTSAIAMIDSENVRWPHYVDSICMNKSFSERWWDFNLYLNDIKDEFLRLYPNTPLTYVGTQSLGALNWSADKIRLSTAFAEYMIDKINSKSNSNLLGI